MREQLRDSLIPKFIRQTIEVDDDVIENTILECFLGKELKNTVTQALEECKIELDIETITYIFEALLEEDNINENGIVFTPLYIANYICDGIWNDLSEWDESYRIIDPGCGCGIFLLASIMYIHTRYNIPVVDIVKNNIYGIDLDSKNVKRCKKLIKAIVLLNNDNICDDDIKIVCADSLKEDWKDLFGVEQFDYIIGNPPYVNTHDMNKETVAFLKKNYITTKSGVFNIFYAFIERSMLYLSPEGKLSYIIPNNFLTIKSATELRAFLQNNKYIKSVLDFSDNMVFKPVRTYNCIIILDKKSKDTFRYCVMEKEENIQDGLNNLIFADMPLSHLDKNGWKLVGHEIYKNIQKIENQFRPIKEFIRTGIATLRDEVFMVNCEREEFYKDIDGKRYIIDSDLVKKLYKIPELKKCDSLEDVCRYIIFPYVQGKNGYEIMPETELLNKYPNTYEYLLARKDILDERDKGKPNSVAWYAYGRTQGLNKYGKKLLFPTFADVPKFMRVDDENALFCNGYGVFENDYMSLDELMPILNSVLMEYYVSNTSYAIEGGYYCYQKKYIEKFSLPFFNEEEKLFLRTSTQSQVDEFLLGKYEVQL